MADPLSIAASVFAIVTAAIQSAKTLNEAVKSYRDRNRTLRTLQDELSHLTQILEALAGATSAEESVLALLKSPVERCSQICLDFEIALKKFGTRSKATVLDWARMEFRKGDINEFIETIAGYKSTISVGLGIITMQTSKVSHKVLVEYNEMIQDTTYNLELHLQRIDEKMTRLTTDHRAAPDLSVVDLRDEKMVTRQCLRVCEEARSYLENLSIGASSLYEVPEGAAQDQLYEAQTRMRQTLDETRNRFTMTSGILFQRLNALLQGQDGGSNEERLRLQSDIEVSKQCLDLCNLATEVSRQKIYRVREAIADGDSDQMVVTTMADLFDVGKVSATDKSAQLVASLSPDELRHITEMRYNSRFGAINKSSVPETKVVKSSSRGPREEPSSPKDEGHEHTLELRTKQSKPSSNEMKKRKSGEDATK